MQTLELTATSRERNIAKYEWPKDPHMEKEKRKLHGKNKKVPHKLHTDWKGLLLQDS